MKRIYHTWDEWECYPAGFYEDRPPQQFKDADCQKLYADFLRDQERFESALTHVLAEWPNSCEHYLSNENMNRVAWLGQASACIALGLPSCFRTGYHLLSDTDKALADALALSYLNKWLADRGEPSVSAADAHSKTIPNLY